MDRLRESVRDYINASKRLLESDALSGEERETILKYLDAIEHLITSSDQEDSH